MQRKERKEKLFSVSLLQPGPSIQTGLTLHSSSLFLSVTLSPNPFLSLFLHYVTENYSPHAGYFRKIQLNDVFKACK